MRLEDRLAKLLEGADVWNAWRQTEGHAAPDLKGAKLRKARLSGADLSGADLSEAELDGALLFGTNLKGACLRTARFYVANLCGADLRGADLFAAYLRGADLRHADLRSADLRDADFRGANLRYADLRNAVVRGADLRDADMRDTDLRGVDLTFVMKGGTLLEGAKLADEPKERRPDPRGFSDPHAGAGESAPSEILGDAAMQRLRHALVDSGSMTELELRDAYEVCRQYARFREDNPKRCWPQLTMVAFIEAIKPHLMFRSWAAVNDKPFNGITALCESLHAAFGREFFDGRKLAKEIPSGMSFGEILGAMGVLTEEQLAEARALRAEIEAAVGVRLFLGTLLVRSSLVTLGEYYQALAIHYGVPFTGLNDETVELIAEEGEFGDLHTRNAFIRSPSSSRG